MTEITGQNKKALLVAFHFPPAAGSSGIQRAYSMARYLPEYGWTPIVLTASTRAHETVEASLAATLPSDLIISRSVAFDAARHLSLGGRYPDFFGYPDRWVTWWLSGVITGLRLIRKHKPTVIWSTYPITTANLIALTLHKITKIPWVADLRDSMTEENYPTDPTKRRIFRWIERKTAQNASDIVFTAPSTLSMYQSRYPDRNIDSWHVVRNGYDEGIFTQAEARDTAKTSNSPAKKLVLLHSGVIYPTERDPTAFFAALSEMIQAGSLSHNDCEIRLRATGHDDIIRKLIENENLGKLVTIMPSVKYSEAINEMLDADGLILMQSANCNHQIPAKLYEYLRTMKPILALTDPKGDTANLVCEFDRGFVARLDSHKEILDRLPAFINRCKSAPGNSLAHDVKHFSRQNQINEIVTIFSKYAI